MLAAPRLLAPRLLAPRLLAPRLLAPLCGLALGVALLTPTLCPALLPAAQAEEPALERSYEVGGLLSRPQPPGPRLGLIGGIGQGALTFDDEEQGSLGPSPEVLLHYLLDEVARAGLAAPELLELRGARLRCLAGAATQRRVAALLRDLRGAQARRARFLIQVVALDQRQASALGAFGGRLGEEARAILAGGETMVRFPFQARSGERVRAALLQRSTFLGDFEVNQTGIAPVLNPVIEELREGWTAEVLCRLPLEQGGAVELTCLVEAAARTGAARTRSYGPGGKLELPSLLHLAFSGSLALHPGEAALLGMAPGQDDDPRTLVAWIQLETPSPEPAPPAGIGRPLRVYPLAALPSPPALARPGWPSDAGSGGAGFVFTAEEGEGGPLDPSAPIATLGLSSTSWAKTVPGGLALAAAPEEHERARATLAAARPSARGLRYELLVLRGLRGPMPQEPLTPAACQTLISKAKGRQSYRLRGLSGHAIELVTRREERFLADIERASGGTGENVIQVDDPIVQTLASGVSLRLSGSVSGEQLCLRADLDLRGAPQLRPATTTWGEVELYSASHLHARREAVLASGSGVLLPAPRGAVRSQERSEVYLVRIWADE